MNGIADDYGWLSGNNGNGCEPDYGISLNLELQKYKAWEYANTIKGYWCIAKRPHTKYFYHQLTGLISDDGFFCGTDPNEILNKKPSLMPGYRLLSIQH